MSHHCNVIEFNVAIVSVFSRKQLIFLVEKSCQFSFNNLFNKKIQFKNYFNISSLKNTWSDLSVPKAFFSFAERFLMVE